MFYISKLLYRFKLEDFSHSVNGNRMAGRVNHWTKNPNRPSPKSNTLILHFAVDVKRLVEEGKDFCWLRPNRCPRCEGQRLWGHGYVWRYFEGFVHGLWMKRYRCPDYRAVHTCRPQEFYRGFHYSRLSILLVFPNRIIYGRLVRCLSRQVQQYWWRGLRFQASRVHNVKVPNRVTLGQLLREDIIPVSHSIQREILRL